jgi:hypothetical protein
MSFVIVVAVGWMYVAVMMAVTEATSSTGTVLGAIVTFSLYGVLPLAIVLYLMTTPARRRARLAALQALQVAPEALSGAVAVEPDQRGHPAGDAVAAKREET